MDFDEIIDFLNLHNIKNRLINVDKHGFSRTIEFKIYDIVYRIVWYKNESKLIIGNNTRGATIQFKYIYLDKAYPLNGGNKSIGFSYSKNIKQSIFDREYPYECFRIPLEV